MTGTVNTESPRPESDEDRRLVAGDVDEKSEDAEWALKLLAGRFAKAVRAPGDHELWTRPRGPVLPRGAERREEVPVGYPRKWCSRPPRRPLRQVLPLSAQEPVT